MPEGAVGGNAHWSARAGALNNNAGGSLPGQAPAPNAGSEADA